MKSKKTSNAVIGIDLGDKKHAVCVIDKNGKILKEFSIPNERKKLEQLAKNCPKARVAMEVGTHSPWISRLLDRLGMEVIVANARKLRAIYTNERKCDRLDAQMLARLARTDPELLHPIEHGSEAAQSDLLPIKLRDALVRQRVQIVSSVRSSLKALGIRTPSTSCASFAKTARLVLEPHPNILSSIEPSLQILESLTKEIRQYDRAIEQAGVNKHPQAKRLRQIPGIGPITSLAFVLIIEDPNRFRDPRDVGAYLGLTPRRDQSGEVDKQLPISKTGNPYLRRLLVQSAQYILGCWGPDSNLRRCGLKLAARGGKTAKKKAVVAVARKLAVLMLVLWQRQSDYLPLGPLKQEAA